MKIICDLISRDLADGNIKTITTHELEDGLFGFVSDNPFPASELLSAVFLGDSIAITYRVAEAFGEA
jgi:hypothetical protein